MKQRTENVEHLKLVQWIAFKPSPPLPSPPLPNVFSILKNLLNYFFSGGVGKCI